MKYVIFSFISLVTRHEHGVEFRDATRNAFRIQRKLGNGSVLMGTERLNTKFPRVPRYSVKVKKYMFNHNKDILTLNRYRYYKIVVPDDIVLNVAIHDWFLSTSIIYRKRVTYITVISVYSRVNAIIAEYKDFFSYIYHLHNISYRRLRE